MRLPLPGGLLPLVGNGCHHLTASAATDTTLRLSVAPPRPSPLCLGAREQSLRTPERLLELSRRPSKVADDFEVRALLPTAGAMSPAPPPYVVCLPHAEPAPPTRQSLRTRLAPPGTAVAPIPAKPVVLPGTGSDETTLSRFTSILSRLEAVTDQVQELREKV